MLKKEVDKYLKALQVVDDNKSVIESEIGAIMEELVDYASDNITDSWEYVTVSEAMEEATEDDTLRLKIYYDNTMKLSEIHFEEIQEPDEVSKFYLPMKYLYMKMNDIKKDFMDNYKQYFNIIK